MVRRGSLGASSILCSALLAAACGDSEPTGPRLATGGGGNAAPTGGTGGTGATGAGGTSTGAAASGGALTGGMASGGLATGASPGDGGAATGGLSSGGAAPTGGGPASGGMGGATSSCEPFVAPEDCEIRDGEVLPSELRCTGLYSDWESKTLHCAARAYAPASALWTDGAGKKRYVALPEGTTIDGSDPDDFVYPVGTKFWKEFSVGDEPQRVGETRLLQKSELGWIYTTYVYDDEGNALQMNDGVEDLFGSGHSVPSREQCKSCHAGRKDYVLGWDLFMMGPGASGITREDLVSEGLLEGWSEAGLDEQTLSALNFPGDETEAAALAYMHANCGVSCHNETTNASGRPSGLYLRVEVNEASSALTTDAVTSGINRNPSPNAETTGLPPATDPFYDFRPLDPERSLSLARMEYRGSATAMPPLGTHQIDEEGVSLVRAWIESMSEARGYPAPAP